MGNNYEARLQALEAVAEVIQRTEQYKRVVAADAEQAESRRRHEIAARFRDGTATDRAAILAEHDVYALRDVCLGLGTWRDYLAIASELPEPLAEKFIQASPPALKLEAHQKINSRKPPARVRLKMLEPNMKSDALGIHPGGERVLLAAEWKTLRENPFVQPLLNAEHRYNPGVPVSLVIEKPLDDDESRAISHRELDQ